MMNSVSNGLDAIKVDGPTGTCVTGPTLCERNQEYIATSWYLYDKDKQAKEEEGNESDSPS
jgi:hypothetical protein